MPEPIPIETFGNGLSTVLEETFEQVHGYYLDRGTSFFETLATVSAEEASRPISARCACLAAQVNHVRFYIDVVLESMKEGADVEADWDASWRIGPVSEEEWQDLLARLRAAYQDLRAFVQTCDAWDEQLVGDAFALVAHCAYHLGEIRQAIGVQSPSA
jgi:hypothetical protein